MGSELEELWVALTLRADSFRQGLSQARQDLSNLRSDVETTGTKTEELGTSLSSTTAKLTAFTAAAAAMTIVADKIRDATDASDKLNQQSVITAYSLNTTTEAVTALAIKTADAEHSVTEMSSAIDLLARAGVGLEDIESTVNSFKMLGEVLGEDTTTIESEVIPALNAFGIKVTDIGDYAYIFANVARTTTLSVSDFAYSVSRLAPNLTTMGLGLEDIAAIFEILADKGIQGRTAMTLFTQTITEMSQETDALKTATSEYESAVKSLNNELENTQDITARFNIEMKYSDVGDIEGIRNLKKQYQIDLELQKYKTNEAQTTVDTTKAAMESAQSASSNKDFYTTFSEKTGVTITPDMVSSQKDIIDADKDMVTAISTAKEQFTTDTDKLKSAMEKLSLSAGDLLQPVQSIATALTTIGPALTAIGGSALLASALPSILGTAGGAAAGTAAAEAAATGAVGATTGKTAAEIAYFGLDEGVASGGLSASIAALPAATLIGAGAAGVGLGALGVYGMEQTGITGLGNDLFGGAGQMGQKGFIEGLGKDFIDYITGDTANAQLMEYLKTHNGQYPEGYNQESLKFGDTNIYFNTEKIATIKKSSASQNPTTKNMFQLTRDLTQSGMG